jgi:hypothetical protein
MNMNIPYKFVPEIYRYIMQKDKDYNKRLKYYYEMEKFNCDVTQFIFEILLKHLLEIFNKTHDNKIDTNKLYKLIHLKINKTNKINKNYLNNIEIYKNYFNIEEKKEEYKELAQKDLLQLLDEYKDIKITFNEFQQFMEMYKDEYLKYITMIIQHISLMQNKLFPYNIVFQDLKFDNFGIIFKTENEPYFDQILDNNIFIDKFFFVYSLDYESSIKINTHNNNNNISNIINKISNINRWSFYGQTNIKNIYKHIDKKIINSLITDHNTNSTEIDFITDVLNYV